MLWNKKTVLFICSFNSVRSQIAEGLLNARCKERYTAFSAGIAPGGLNPYAVAVMKEAGIDISSQKSKKLSHFSGTRFDFVITLCDRAKGAVHGSIPQERLHSTVDLKVLQKSGRIMQKSLRISAHSGTILNPGYWRSSRIVLINGMISREHKNEGIGASG